MTRQGPLPQAVVTPLTPAAIFLVMTVNPGRASAARERLPEISDLVRAVSMRSLEDGLVCVTGIGAEFWDRAFSAPRPTGLHPFIPIEGATHTAPSTPGDLLFHIRAQRMDLCFELAHRLSFAFRGIATIIDEVHGFRYWDARNLLGFVDGTENPRGPVAEEVAITGAESDFPGSSIVIVQRYRHDLDGWHGLTVEEQEAAMGRTKLSDIELSDAVKPTNSHVALNTIEDPDGTEHEILRDNMPFGSVADGNYGTYFIGYAADVTTTEQMLVNMFIGDPPGNHDRILDFSTAETGGLFFVPSQDALDDPDLLDRGAGPREAPEPPVDDPAEEARSEPAPATDDTSLGIGGLRGRPVI